MLLGFTRDPKAFLAVRAHIDGTHKDRKAYAQEILDVVFSREEKSPLHARDRGRDRRRVGRTGARPWAWSEPAPRSG